MSVVPMDKFCPSCHSVRPSADFYRNVRKTDGLQTQCKACCCEATASRRTRSVTKPTPAIPRDTTVADVRRAAMEHHTMFGPLVPVGIFNCTGATQ
jgi:hypothetical protein